MVMVAGAGSDWWTRQRVCVTGGRGGLGQRLVQRLVLQGTPDVVSFDRTPAPDYRGEAAAISAVAETTGSILVADDLDRALQGCTLLFHLAALTHAGVSQEQPARYYEVNGLGTTQVLDAARRNRVAVVVYTSTSHVYGIPDQLPVPESHPLRPRSAYAGSKVAGEIAVQQYATSYGLRGVITRLANLYGGHVDPETVIGRAITQAVGRRRILLRELTPVCDFLHVDDAVEALLRLAVVGATHSGCLVVNVSPGRGYSIQQIAEIIADAAAEETGERSIVGRIDDQPPGECSALVMANDYLRTLTGWAPEIAMEVGLRRTLHEYARARQKQNA